MTTVTESRRMATWLTIWSGQMMSLVGSVLTEFVLSVWVFERTGSVTQFALMNVFIWAPLIIVSPWAGALADIHDRRLIMIASNGTSALVVIAVSILVGLGQLQVWEVYIAVLLLSASAATLFPAFAASMPDLVPEHRLGRANGMVQFADSGARLVGPPTAAALLAGGGLWVVLIVDMSTYVFAILSLLAVRIPRVVTPGPRKAFIPGLSAVKPVLAFLLREPGPRTLLLFLVVLNISAGFYLSLFTPLVLSFASTGGLGTVAAVGGAASMLGAVLMMVWGGPRERRVYAVIGFAMFSGAGLITMGLRPSLIAAGLGAFCFLFGVTVVSASNQTMWQSKVPGELLGRVLGVNRMVAWTSLPLSFLIAGPLADYVFEPLMRPGGALADPLGGLIGVGEGRGIGLQLVLVGAVPVVAAIGSCLSPSFRRLDEEFPDMTPIMAGARR